MIALQAVQWAAVQHPVLQCAARNVGTGLNKMAGHPPGSTAAGGLARGMAQLILGPQYSHTGYLKWFEWLCPRMFLLFDIPVWLDWGPLRSNWDNKYELPVRSHWLAAVYCTLAASGRVVWGRVVITSYFCCFWKTCLDGDQHIHYLNLHSTLIAPWQELDSSNRRSITTIRGGEFT